MQKISYLEILALLVWICLVLKISPALSKFQEKTGKHVLHNIGHNITNSIL
jgi:hypothetical protein